ncbi:hypothetical protein PanWU01x14_255590 [Parasponia andersonii]|uniref:Uncharacterized protein n=1 Tax=Parasponia andersonii TaxID=3476 RepID=A0A2P5BAS2_PARAD|nr:hypothetical protein PanWU01x14_255590 [Parasponia andersonii]
MSMVLQLERSSNVFVMKIKDVLQQALNNVINRAAIH